MLIRKGQSLIEILVAMGLAAVLLPAFLTGTISSREGKAQSEQRLAASAMLKETIESVRSVRAGGWNIFAVNGIFHPAISGSLWTLVSGSETVNGLTRAVTIEDVFRNGQSQIASTGTYDPSTKKVTASVSWAIPQPGTLSTVLYLSRYLDNLTWTQTLNTEFNSGTLSNVAVTNLSGGEVQLSQNTKAKWCTPELSTATIDLPDGPPVAVAAFADLASTSNPNQVFVATAPLDSVSTKMAFVNVTANSDPPVPSLKGTFTLDPAKYSSAGLVPTGIDLDNNFKTNDVKYYKSSSGSMYALLATNKPDKEVVVVKINNGTTDTYQDSVNKIYKYWTSFNTRIYGSAFNVPAANAADSGGDGNGYQTNPTNAYANDGSFAVDTNSGSNTGTNCLGTDKDKHRFYNYNFSVPASAVVNGIELNLVAKTDSTTGTPKICVQLSWDGGTTWTTAKTTANLTTSNASYTLGGPADDWGRSWASSNFTNANFRVRVINVASNNSRDFSLDWVAAKVYYNGATSSSNDEAPFGYGATDLTILGNTGYLDAGGYLYAFDLSNIDSKSSSSELDQVGCRILLDGYNCQPNNGTDMKYDAGETGSSWSDTTSPAHLNCSDGGNIELYADHQLSGVQVGSNKYVYVAVGAGTNPELNIVDVTTPPSDNSTLTNASCGRGGNTGWKVTGSLDFDPASNTEEAANSVFAKSDGTRAYMSSNGGIIHNNIPDSDQFYIIDTSNKAAPKFLTTWPSTVANQHYQNTAQSGYYNGNSTNIQLYPRRALTVLNGQRAVLVGQDGVSDSIEPQEYQVLNLESEQTPAYCGGINFLPGFNDLTSVSEADGDNFVYMVANTNQNELKIIQGGPDGNYVESGNYESVTFDAGQTSAFNYFGATVSNLANTSVKVQIGVTSPGAASCNGAVYSFIGPDGTGSTFFTPASASISANIPIGDYSTNYHNPGRCFRYKTFFSTTDYNSTPLLYDAFVNYSP